MSNCIAMRVANYVYSIEFFRGCQIEQMKYYLEISSLKTGFNGIISIFFYWLEFEFRCNCSSLPLGLAMACSINFFLLFLPLIVLSHSFMLIFSYCIRDETFLSNSIGFNEHAKHRNYWKWAKKNRTVQYELTGLCPAYVYSTHINTLTELCWNLSHFRFSHKSFESNCSTACMPSMYTILDIMLGWQLASMLKCNYGPFFPILFLFVRRLSGIFSVFIWNSSKFHFGTQHTIIH